MTDAQREQIRVMRDQGMGYTAIARTAGLSKDSVKAFCRSHGLSGVRGDNTAPVEVEVQLCACCGKPFVQTPGRKKRRFCCDECRVRWWNSQPDQVKRKALYHFVCPVCGKEFTAYGNGRKYCSHPCYITARFRGGENHE